MRIGTRIVIATSVLVALTLGIYGYAALRSLRLEREHALEKQAGELAKALRVVLETRGFAAADSADLADQFRRAGIPWKLSLVDAKDAQIDREHVHRLLAIKRPLSENKEVAGHSTFTYFEPVWEEDPSISQGYKIVGAVRLERDMTFLQEEMRDTTIRVVGSMVILILAIVLAISLLARRGIVQPIGKLLAGIDDVARGDLSRVLLQERDDEIGTLAAKFNDMTTSLREARAETRRNIDQLRQAEKLAVIGQLSAEIAHEVGTPLNVVSGRARAMVKKADDPETVRKNATIIAEQAARITRIIQRLLDFARRRVGDTGTTVVDLNQLAQGTLEFLEHQIANGRIESALAFDAGLPPVPGDRDQLQQVLLNLFMNAIQAMPEGGTLTVTTTRVVRQRPGLELAPEQGYAALFVEDTGVGIPEESRAKIFEPFYTSKSDAGGTGLGLAVAHGIVKDHDGWIDIDSARSGQGTVFKVFLPLRAAEET